jgi:hypothetical protein
VTGHVAESVVEVLPAGLGDDLRWHFTGPGRHGVDLVVPCPRSERVVVVNFAAMACRAALTRDFVHRSR